MKARPASTRGNRRATAPPKASSPSIPLDRGVKRPWLLALAAAALAAWLAFLGWMAARG